MADFLNTNNFNGSLPSTVAPFSMDLASPISVIAQRMIEDKKQQIAESKAEVDRNTAFMLKALDFETVQGLSDAVQSDHLKKVDGLMDHWAGVMAQKKGKLSFNDLLDINKDKREMDMDIANKKANVLAFANLQNEVKEQKIKNPLGSYIDIPQTEKNMALWAQAGNIGKPTLGLMVPRAMQPAEIIEGTYGDQLKALAQKVNEKLTGIKDDDAKYTIIKDYQNNVDTLWNQMKQDPRIAPIQEMGKHYVDAQYGGEQLVEKIVPGYGRGSGKPNEKNIFTGGISPYTSVVDPNRTWGDAYVVQKAGSPVSVSYTDPDSKAVTSAKITPLALRADGILEANAITEIKKTSPPMSQMEARNFQFQMGGSGTIIPSGDQYKVVYSDIATRPVKIPYTSDTRTKLARLFPEMEKYYNETTGVYNAIETPADKISKSKESMEQIEKRIREERTQKAGFKKIDYGNLKLH